MLVFFPCLTLPSASLTLLCDTPESLGRTKPPGQDQSYCTWRYSRWLHYRALGVYNDNTAWLFQVIFVRTAPAVTSTALLLCSSYLNTREKKVARVEP